MGSPLERLKSVKEKLRHTPGNQATQGQAQMEANLDCAIEINEALIGLTFAVNDVANRTVDVLNRLTAAIDKATAQAEISSHEATSVSKESAKVSRQLNRLTVWIIIAAILSAVAAAIQAGTALYGILK
jgi:hypothetical protein